MKRLLIVLALLSTLAAATASTARADDFQCTGLLSGVIPGNVVVPPGAFCTLRNATVHGDVKVLQNADLEAQQNRIDGSIQGDKAGSVHSHGDTVGGNIEAKDGGPSSRGFIEVWINSTVPNGNIIVERMTGEFRLEGGFMGGPNSVRDGNMFLQHNVVLGFMDVLGNTMEENLQVFKTTGPGTKRIVGNTVGESLQCFENAVPFIGGPNVARDSAGQCF